MYHPIPSSHRLGALRFGALGLALFTGSLMQTAVAGTQISGEAVAFRSTVLGISSSLADTGTLAGAGDMKQASQLTGGIPSLVSTETLSATTASASDAVVSQASLSKIGLTLAGNTLSAGFLLAQANAPAGSVPTGMSDIEALVVNGATVYVSGEPNQVIPLIGGRIVLNEQTVTSDGSEVVNAVHVVIYGVADIVLASATAGMSGTSSPLPPLPLIGGLGGFAALQPAHSDALLATYPYPDSRKPLWARSRRTVNSLKGGVSHARS